MTVVDSTPSADAHIQRLGRATDIHEFELAWTEGLRSVQAPDCRDRILAEAGSQLGAFGQTADDRLRRSWLSQVVEEVRMRGGDSLAAGLRSVVVAELREAFANARCEFAALRASGATGEPVEDFTLRSPPVADRIRDLGRMAQRLRGSGLMALVSSEDAGLARDLAAAMIPQDPVVATVPEPWRVGRDRLRDWAKGPTADLPGLVRRLIAETVPSAERIDMPSGSAEHQSGWDGLVRCAKGNRFVPGGPSGWELSTQQNGSDGKARSDYAKRIENTPDAEHADMAYVAVVCAPWTKAREFEREKSCSGDFRTVRALNVDSLADWLECAPLTTVWLRERMDEPVGVTLLSAWWAQWLASTTVPLDAPTVLAGRDDQAETLRDRCRQRRGGVITVGGVFHPDEILAFVAAALVGSDSAGPSVVDALFVDDRSVAQRLLSAEASATAGRSGAHARALTVVAPSADFAGCLPAASRHRLIVPVPRGSQSDIVLEAVDSETVTARMRASGRDTHTAHDLGTLARRSLLALRRRLAVKPELHRPPWAGSHIEANIRRSLMLNNWNETSVGDRRIVERFMECSYEEATEALRRLDPGDAPMIVTDERWYVASPADAWTLVSRHLTCDDIEDFGVIAHEVLTEPDPFYGMSGRDSMIARYEGTEATHSHQLRSGVATTLALLGSRPPKPRGASAPFTGAADGIVHGILQAANDDPSPRVWAAVARELPLLAEAAPSAVLRGLRTCISESHAFATAMFADSTDDDTLFGPGSPHLHVIEALETLAWSPDYLNPAADALASLAANDPGGTWSNRPSSSLASIMYGWRPHTSAGTDARLQAVEMLRERHGPVAWNLMLSMLPEGHGPQTVERGPLYRDWKRESVVTGGEYLSVVDSAGKMMVEDAGADPDRWANLVERIGVVTVDARRALVEALAKIAASDPGEAFRSAVWPELREAVSNQRENFDTDWALPESELEGFDPLLENLRPSAPATAYGWLFSSDYVMADGRRWADDHDAHSEALAAKRTAAIGKILAAGGIDAVLELVETAEAPYAVGVALANQGPALDVEMLGILHESSGPVTAAALTYFESRIDECGWELVDRLIAHHALSEQVVADLLRAVPAVEAPWRRADALGAGVAAEYWARVSPLELRPLKSSDQLREVSGRLRSAGRAAAAIRLVCVWEHRHESTPEVAEEAAACLEDRLQQQDPEDPAPVSRHDLAELLKMLDRHRDHLGAGRVATLEWQYLPAVAHAGDTGTPNLYRQLAQDPDLFVSLVEIAYPPASASPGDGAESDDTDRQRALNAHRLLRSWPLGTFSPGGDGQEGVDAEQLDGWVDHARSRLSDIDRQAIGDTMIGRALAASPADPDVEWPSAAVRDLIDRVESDCLDDGFTLSVFDQRGGTSRLPTDGGGQERELAAHYRARSSDFSRWPHTASIFDRLARAHESEADVHDRRAEAHRIGLWRARKLVGPPRRATLRFPLLFASLTGRSGHGLARMGPIRSPIRSASWRRLAESGAACRRGASDQHHGRGR